MGKPNQVFFFFFFPFLPFPKEVRFAILTRLLKPLTSNIWMNKHLFIYLTLKLFLVSSGGSFSPTQDGDFPGPRVECMIFDVSNGMLRNFIWAGGSRSHGPTAGLFGTKNCKPLNILPSFDNLKLVVSNWEHRYQPFSTLNLQIRWHGENWGGVVK